jgi:hypothetical protein
MAGISQNATKNTKVDVGVKFAAWNSGANRCYSAKYHLPATTIRSTLIANNFYKSPNFQNLLKN